MPLKHLFEKYNAIFEQSPIAVEFYDNDGNLVNVNNGCLDLFGIKDIKEIYGFKLFEDPNLTDNIKERLLNNENVRFEINFDFDKVKSLNLYNTTKSGVAILDISITRLFNEDFHFGYILQIQDITIRKNYEHDLLASEIRYRRLFESAQDGIIILDANNGMIVDVNPFLIDLLGYSKEQFLNKYIWEIGFLKDIIYNKDKFLKLQENEYVRYKDLPLETSEGKTIKVEFVSNVYLVDNTRVIQCNIRDMTEMAHERKLRILSNDILIILNSDLDLKEMIDKILYIIKDTMNFSAIGFRLKKSDDYPYFSYYGFSDEFIFLENSLVNRNICKDENGRPSLECTCGLVINGNKDKKNPLFTENGSIWTNHSFSCLGVKIEDDIRTNPRNRCIHEGYGSVAIIPIKTKNEIIGILQINEKKINAFSENTIISFEGICLNIGNALMRKQSEDELLKAVENLRNSKDFAENLINTANVMVVGLDNNGRVNIFNRASEQLTGYDRNEIIGKNWFKDLLILPKDELNFVHEVFDKLLNNDENTSEFENSIITKHGEIKYILWQNNEVRENGEIVGIISFGLDITERKISEEKLIKAKERAEESDKLKLEFLGNMSHDLRTPMNAIIGFSDLLKSNNLNKNERNDYINTIIENGKFLMALIDDIIDISKIDAGALKVEKSDFELNKLFEDIRMTFFKQVKDKKIDIILNIDINKNIIVNTDKYRLKQILTNLISNAIKFTKNGYIKFGYNLISNEQLIIYVEDTGIGIEKNYQKIIFNKFKQLDENKNKFKGAGLGLSISKSLIELLGFKEIKLISEVGKGSKFYFQTPYTIKHFSYMSEIKNKNKNKNKRLNLLGKKILIIEDDKDTVTIMKSHLFETKAEIFMCFDGDDDILSIIKNNHIDLVLLDIGLPGKNGYEILRDIREYDERLPIIIESAVAMPDQRSKAYKLGCNEFLSKPFTREDFLNKIDYCI